MDTLLLIRTTIFMDKTLTRKVKLALCELMEKAYLRFVK